MTTIRRRRALALLWPAAVLIILAQPVAADDWSIWRGPLQTGSIDAKSISDGALALEVAWSAPLGSSYSAVSVSGGTAFTLFAADDDDLLIALDAATGKQRWRARVGPRTVGHDGSDDGPLSTPAVAGGRVFVLTPDGTLVAFGAKRGRELWRQPLAKQSKAKSPYFGFATTPLPVDDLVVVQLGGEQGGALTAVAAKDGSPRWTAAKGATVYQSPVLTTLAGRRQIVSTLKTRTLAVDPTDGGELWSVDLEAASTATPVPVADDGLLVASRGGLTLLRVASDAEGRLNADAVWTSSMLKPDNAMPVVVGRHVYGFNGNFLTCLSLADGSRVWRSRPPGGLGVIAVDGTLAIHGAEGRFVLVEGSPDGYAERASVKIGDAATYTWPSFADGLFFVRDLEQAVAIRVVPDKTGVNQDGDPSAAPAD